MHATAAHDVALPDCRRHLQAPRVAAQTKSFQTLMTLVARRGVAQKKTSPQGATAYSCGRHLLPHRPFEPSRQGPQVVLGEAIMNFPRGPCDCPPWSWHLGTAPCLATTKFARRGLRTTKEEPCTARKSSPPVESGASTRPS